MCRWYERAVRARVCALRKQSARTNEKFTAHHSQYRKCHNFSDELNTRTTVGCYWVVSYHERAGTEKCQTDVQGLQNSITRPILDQIK